MYISLGFAVRELFANHIHICLILPSCRKSEIATVSSPLYHTTIISHDCEVALEKLGQNNLVHCPHKLELPFLPLSAFCPAAGFICCVMCREEHTANQAADVIGPPTFRLDLCALK